MRKKVFKKDVPSSVILPLPLQRAIANRAEKEERTFSAVVRRALRRELGLSEDENREEEEQTIKA